MKTASEMVWNRSPPSEKGPKSFSKRLCPAKSREKRLATSLSQGELSRASSFDGQAFFLVRFPWQVQAPELDERAHQATT